MAIHLQRDLDALKKEILTMGSMVEEAIVRSIAAFLQRREDMAESVRSGDAQIDRKENEIEDHVLKILALHQPVAADLRFVVMCSKVNHDLERMGDLAKNVAERTVGLLREEPLSVALRFADMSERVRVMVRESMDALVEGDAQLARQVIAGDDAVDDLHREMFSVLEDCMRDDPGNVSRAVRLLSLSRYLERIADHATNIAEDIIFMVEGEIVRHKFGSLAQ